MMTFEYYDPRNRHRGSLHLEPTRSGGITSMQCHKAYHKHGSPSVTNSMIPNGGAAFGTNGALGSICLRADRAGQPTTLLDRPI